MQGCGTIDLRHNRPKAAVAVFLFEKHHKQWISCETKMSRGSHEGKMGMLIQPEPLDPKIKGV